MRFLDTGQTRGVSYRIMEDAFRKELETLMEKHKYSSSDVINSELKKLADKHNNTGRTDFDGLSSEQMSKLLYFKLNENMIKIKDERGTNVPIIKQINYFLNIVEDAEEIKLTKAGHLPPAIVKDIYSQKYLTDDLIEWGISKLTKETDSTTVELTHILCQASGLIRKKNGKISLTKNGKKTLEAKNFLSLILSTFISKFNWSYFDRYMNEMTGQFGAYYSVYLLDKYGNEKRDAGFYANKYFQAFPKTFSKEYSEIETSEELCYTRRTFDRFFKYFGFLENYYENKIGIRFVKKTETFEKYIEVEK
ncbi:MAG: hypothetical protein LBP29_08470 [Treponema sp.]|jgi:hypothetical protein|nr:hypothetical protein [Treponema sp.]